MRLKKVNKVKINRATGVNGLCMDLGYAFISIMAFSGFPDEMDFQQESKKHLNLWLEIFNLG